VRSTDAEPAIPNTLEDTPATAAGTYLCVRGAEGEAPVGERRRVRPCSIYEVRRDAVEVGRGRQVADADHGEHLARGLEVLPGRRHAAAEHELEAEASGLPGLVLEGALLVLRVVGAERGEVDARVARHQRRVLAQARRRDRAAHGEHRDADGGTGLDAQPGLHGRRWLVPPASPRLTSLAPGRERQI